MGVVLKLNGGRMKLDLNRIIWNHVAQSCYSVIGDKLFLYEARQNSTVRKFVFTGPIFTRLRIGRRQPPTQMPVSFKLDYN